MLKRIRRIAGVGVYANCTASAVEFKRVTLVYGDNTTGKSTLARILRSLETGDATSISSHPTIPEVNSQDVVLQFAEGPQSPEATVRLVHGQWEPTFSSPIHVFDSDFVSTHLFSGAKGGDQSDNAFTNLVLGQQGVAHARALAKLRKELVEVKAAIGTLRKQLETVEDVDEFVAMHVDRTEEQVRSDLQLVLFKAERLRRESRARKDIQKRKLLKPIPTIESRPFPWEQLKAILSSSMPSAEREDRRMYDDQVQRYIEDGPADPEWLKVGLAQMRGETCPFCRDVLKSATSREAIDTYRRFFDERYQNQLQQVFIALDASERALLEWRGELNDSAIQDNGIVLTSYREFESEDSYLAGWIDLHDAADRVRAAANPYTETLELLRREVRQSISKKRLTPHDVVAFSHRQVDSYKRARDVLDRSIGEYNRSAQELNDVLVSIKRRAAAGTVDTEIETNAALQQTLQLELRRLHNAQTCELYREGKRREGLLEEQISKTTHDIARDQHEFLSRFFDEINGYFLKFGGRRFSMERRIDTQGTNPIASIVVCYNGVEIHPGRIRAVFSESDRRALALSVFFSKIAAMPQDKRLGAIVVLDDPVTSFDDGRITATILQLGLEARSLGQLIVLTHYQTFARRFLQLEANSEAFSFLELRRDAQTSTVIRGDETPFVVSDQERIFKKVCDFIDGTTEQPIDHDLRRYLENEIRGRYRLQLLQLALTHRSLSDMISGLVANNVIKPIVGEEAHAFRRDLNQPHHTLETRSRVDWVSTAERVFDFVYHRL
jgi:wobble nucleotide-excising tRNase